MRTTSANAPRQPLRIVAVGDVSLNGRYHALLSERGPDYPFRRLRDRWRQFDLRCANLESPISSLDRAAPTKFTLRAAPQTCDALRAGGFDCVVLANNHMMDFGSAGLMETIERLDAAGIPHVGAGADLAAAARPLILERNGRALGLLAFCDVVQVSKLYATADSPGVAPADLEFCREAVGKLRSQTDWVIVHLHWGLEMCRLPAPTQRRWAEILAGAGADVIIGHHPHVVQPLEHVRNTVVAYSLGDFVFSSAYWHGVNGSGTPFLGRYEVHPRSRRTAWLEVELPNGGRPRATLHPALLKRDLTVVEQPSPARRRELARLAAQLAGDDYARRFQREAKRAQRRDRWRFDYRRVSVRCRLKLLKHGWLPGASVEPDGPQWRSRFNPVA